jgi:hypothetical protein
MLEGDWQLALFKSSNGLRVSLEISNQPGPELLVIRLLMMKGGH